MELSKQRLKMPHVARAVRSPFARIARFARNALCLSVALGGCAKQPRISDVVSASSEHYESFARFERWATRMLGSDVRLQGPLALREATFAPLRSDPDVLWAEVRANERQLLQYPKPEAVAPPSNLRFVNVDAPAFGRLSVALSDACRARTDKPVPCVVIARPDGERAGNPVRIAFRRGLSGGARAAR